MTEEPAAVYVHPGQLEPWDENPRHNDKAAKRLARTIKALGFSAPIVAQKSSGRILAGHTRWKAAHILGLEAVPVRFMDVDNRIAEQIALADNAEGLSGSWDNPALARVLSRFSLEEADLMGWDEKALERLADEVPELGPLEEDGSRERCESCGKLMS